MKYICQYCGKEYEVNPKDGDWGKNNIRGKGCHFMDSTRFCCYECGREDRKRRIQEKWKNKSKEELTALQTKKQNNKKPETCVVCGKKYIPNASANISITPLCSEECREIYNAKESGIYYCQECGKEIHYTKLQGNYNKDNQLVHPKGKSKGFTVSSWKFCCYECGIKHKEKLRKQSNIDKNGHVSPFSDPIIRENIYNKLKENGKLFTSKGETEIKEFVESLGFVTTKLIKGDGKTSERIEVDIYIPEKQIGIEYNGTYFHAINGKKEGSISKVKHQLRHKACTDLGIDLITVWEDLWESKKDLVKSILTARLGVIDKDNRIYARQCTIKEISTQEYKNFTEKNHIQGYAKAKVKLGLFYNNQLVQIASFSKVHNTGKAKVRNSQFEYNWVRGCPSSNNLVIGGTSKLLNYFIKTYNPESILCYSDLNLFNGNGYKECGFTLTGKTGPDKFYVSAHGYKRFNRSPFKYKEYKEKVKKKQLFECYGVGSLIFTWKKS